jgi:hypothetical protein
VAKESFYDKNVDPGSAQWMLPWRCVSLALMEYRTKSYTEAIDWGNRCLAYGDDSPPRTATIQAILALSYHQLGQQENARSALAQSRELINAKFQKGLDAGDGGKGYWFDWVLAQIIEQEAIATIKSPETSAK